MLDSESVYTNAHHFTSLMCHQITWAVINDICQYFFCTLTEHQFMAGTVWWPTSLLMQIIGADTQACREIKMGNFPAKWMTTANGYDGCPWVGWGTQKYHSYSWGYLCPSRWITFSTYDALAMRPGMNTHTNARKNCVQDRQMHSYHLGKQPLPPVLTPDGSLHLALPYHSAKMIAQGS